MSLLFGQAAGKDEASGRFRLIVWERDSMGTGLPKHQGVFPLRLAASVLITVLLALGGCAGTSVFYPPTITETGDGTRFFVEQPESTVVVIYTPGSKSNNDPGRCDMTDTTSWLGMPGVFRDLAGTTIAGKRVVVYGYCSEAVGRIDWDTGLGPSKPEVRAEDLERLIGKFERAGVPSRHLFVAGHSIGGWTALLVERRGNVDIGGAVAIAPAFAGKWDFRADEVQRMHDRSAAYLREARHMDALVFAFEEDPFNLPNHLAFLGTIPGVTFLRLNNTVIDGVACEGAGPHFLFLEDCFRKTQKRRIVDFINARLRFRP